MTTAKGQNLTMGRTPTISHAGTVVSVRDGMVGVEIVQMSACSACQARNLCRASEMKEKTLQIAVPDASVYSVGQSVELVGRESLGMKAVLYAFGVPLVLLLLALVVTMALCGNEKAAALAGIAVIAVYYAVLYAFRGRLGREFQFSIREPQSDM